MIVVGAAPLITFGPLLIWAHHMFTVGINVNLLGPIYGIGGFIVLVWFVMSLVVIGFGFRFLFRTKLDL